MTSDRPKYESPSGDKLRVMKALKRGYLLVWDMGDSYIEVGSCGEVYVPDAQDQRLFLECCIAYKAVMQFSVRRAPNNALVFETKALANKALGAANAALLEYPW